MHGSSIGRRAKGMVAGAAVGLMLIAGTATTAVAAGAGGGNFTCTQSGVPGWGTVTSKYYHASVSHWATAVGKGRQTVTAAKGKTAVAKIGRTVSDNACYWGKN